ncbi:MAG: hypothetical protein ABI068_00230 [Ktedonobacterales bacterium]
MLEDLDERAFLDDERNDNAPDDTHSDTGAAAMQTELVPITPREWVSPGVSLGKRILTGLGVALVALVFFFIAWYEGIYAWVSTVIGIVFIGGFIGYLRVVAPTPFTLRLAADGVTRTDRGGAPVTIAWDGIVRIKEEVFRSGVSVSVTVYKRVGERGVHRAYVVYRDDVPHFDELVSALRDALPASATWVREKIHE